MFLEKNKITCSTKFHKVLAFTSPKSLTVVGCNSKIHDSGVLLCSFLFQKWRTQIPSGHKLLSNNEEYCERGTVYLKDFHLESGFDITSRDLTAYPFSAIKVFKSSTLVSVSTRYINRSLFGSGTPLTDVWFLKLPEITSFLAALFCCLLYCFRTYAGC